MMRAKPACRIQKGNKAYTVHFAATKKLALVPMISRIPPRERQRAAAAFLLPLQSSLRCAARWAVCHELCRGEGLGTRRGEACLDHLQEGGRGAPHTRRAAVTVAGRGPLAMRPWAASGTARCPSCAPRAWGGHSAPRGDRRGSRQLKTWRGRCEYPRPPPPADGGPQGGPPAWRPAMVPGASSLSRRLRPERRVQVEGIILRAGRHELV